MNLRRHIFELYDPLHHNVDAEEAMRTRLQQLAPLSRGIPALLRQAGWYAATPYEDARAHSDSDKLKIWVAPPHRKFVQHDSVNCGIYTAMMIERLISGAPNSQEWAEQNLVQFRKYMACAALAMCILQYQ